MGYQSADTIFDYMEDLDSIATEHIGYSTYNTEEELEEYYRAIYDALVAAEAVSPRLAYADDDSQIAIALEMLTNENFHGAAAALMAYMVNYYDWEGVEGYDPESHKRSYPFLYED